MIQMTNQKNTNKIKKERADRIKQIRVLTGMTQKQFAEELRMSREGYQKLERGENNVSLDVLESLKRVYGISADYILYGELEGEEKIWDMLINCSDDTRLVVLLRLAVYFSSSEEKIFLHEDDRLKEVVDQIVIKGKTLKQ